MHFSPKRGISTSIHKAQFVENELFYVTDLKMMGVTDDNAVPQLLVEVLEFDTESDFPTRGEPNKIYKTNTDEAFFFNGESYSKVKINTYFTGSMPSFMEGERRSLVVKLRDK